MSRERSPQRAREDYVRHVGAHYLRLRGKGLTLSTLDLERIGAWEQRGIPLELVDEALRRAHAGWLGGGRSQRLRPLPLERVERELAALVEVQRRRYGGPPQPRAGQVPSPPAEAPSPAAGAQGGRYATNAGPDMSDPLLPISNPLKALLDDLHQRVDRQGLEPPTPEASHCSRCRGAGYQIGPEGAVAVAKACDCELRCETCNGKGFLVERRGGYEFSRPCPCQTLPKRIAAFNAAQLPARFWNKNFDNFYVQNTDPKAVQEAKEALRGFAHGDTPGRLGMGLIGGPGRGKTHLLTATLAALSLGRGIPCRYIEISFLFADLKAAISDPRARATVDKIEELAEVEVLAIDELGKGRGSVFEEEVLDELIGRRYNNEKPTLFATNYPIEEQQGDPLGQSLRARVGERIFSRLHEMVVFLELPQRTNDHRLLLRKMMR